MTSLVSAVCPPWGVYFGHRPVLPHMMALHYHRWNSEVERKGHMTSFNIVQHNVVNKQSASNSCTMIRLPSNRPTRISILASTLGDCSFYGISAVACAVCAVLYVFGGLQLAGVVCKLW